MNDERSRPSTSEPPRHNSSGSRGGFVRVVDGRFELDGERLRFLGANLWYAAYLGADAPFGDRARLVRELDRLAALGVTNLRILAGSEQSPQLTSLQPAFRDETGRYHRELLDGLDFVLSEMKKRNMRAVLYLTNFWEWSGGMRAAVSWTNGGSYGESSWPESADFAASFYGDARAVQLYHDYVRAIVSRINHVTGIAYTDDPTIFSFQLGNEPRPGASPEAIEKNREPFFKWLRGTARLIRSIATDQLISTGGEGLMGCAGSVNDVLLAHEDPEIDYLTAHIWPQNWGWVKPAELAGTYAGGETRTRDYIGEHIRIAEKLGRPLVIEEFGFPRDDGSFAPSGTTAFRDRFYALILDAVLESAGALGPLAGSNFWAWGGEGRAEHSDLRWREADTSYLGDPPHEPQGWYSVFDGDETTKELLRAHADALSKL